MNAAGYQNYKEQSLYTMTQGELLLVLYDEMLKRLMRAELSAKQQDYKLFDQSIKRCNEITNYLIDTLNFQYPISHDLKRMYDFFKFQIARIDASRSVDRVAELKDLVKDLRDAFAEAEKLTNI